MVDVNGVGYEMEAPIRPSMGCRPRRTRRVVPPLVVREMRIILYAFGTTASGVCFAFAQISGVGPKIGWASCPGQRRDFCHLEAEDIAMLTRIPGIGRRRRARHHRDARQREKLSMPAGGATPAGMGVGPGATAQSEAFSALIALGYKPRKWFDC